MVDAFKKLVFHSQNDEFGSFFWVISPKDPGFVWDMNQKNLHKV